MGRFHVVPHAPFILQTDASTVAVAAVLLQMVTEGPFANRWTPTGIVHISRLLRGAEALYSTVEHEALALVWSTDKLRSYITGHPLTVQCDAANLEFMLSSSNARVKR